MNGESVHHTIESLCEAYCPPLEASLVYALASDYDFSNDQSLRELQGTLDGLKDSAVIEQDLELLPQNAVSENFRQPLPTSETKPASIHHADLASSNLSQSAPLSATEDDAVTSVTTSMSGLKYSELDDSDSGIGPGYGEAGLDFDKLSEDEKCQWLCNMFPNAGTQNAKEVLAKSEGNFERSIDELLNISFLKDSNEDHGDQVYMVPKGIDAFLQREEEEDSLTRRKSKGKGRRRHNRNEYIDSTETLGSDSAISSGAVTPNVWKNLPEDVEFMASRIYLKPKTITSVYHANGARLAPTIRALVIKEGEVYQRARHKIDDIVEWQIEELKVEFESVPNSQIYGALMLAKKMPSAAKELLDAMLTSNEQPTVLGKVTGLASYTPIDLSEDETVVKKSFASNLVPASGGVYTTSHLVNSHGQAATQAFQQASAAYKRGKSDHLMGGAAAYYASVGHERIKAAKALQASAADAHVAGQSSLTVLDLHGVNVSDAVRIAQRGTTAWWEGLGDRKYVVGGKGDGYRIVTGVGRHSSDGVGRIGPAVSKMLVREGWKVEVGRGEIVVSGRQRR